MEPIEKNDSPFLKGLGLAALTTALLLVAALLTSRSLDIAATLAGTTILAGAVVGAWANQASRRWAAGGFVWRFAVCWLLSIALSAACGVFTTSPPPG